MSLSSRHLFSLYFIVTIQTNPGARYRRNIVNDQPMLTLCPLAASSASVLLRQTAARVNCSQAVPRGVPLTTLFNHTTIKCQQGDIFIGEFLNQREFKQLMRRDSELSSWTKLRASEIWRFFWIRSTLPRPAFKFHSGIYPIYFSLYSLSEPIWPRFCSVVVTDR